MNTLITAILVTMSLACSNSEEVKRSSDKANVSQTIAKSECFIAPPTFKIYGELAPVDYLNGGEDELTLAHGFLVERVSGCEITPELVQSVKENNRIANEQMIASFGENWKADFEEKTKMNFDFPAF